MTPSGRIQRGLALVCILFFGFHWFAIIVTTSGATPVSQSLGDVTARYSRPLFRQGWRLFAPDPAKFSKRFLYRCHAEESGWGDWKSAVAPLLRQHYAMRVTHHGKLLRIPLELMAHVSQEVSRIEQEIPCAGDDTSCLRQRSETLKRRRVYREAQRFSKEHCEADLHAANQKLVGAQFEFEMAYAKPFERRNDPSVRPRINRYEFDAFEIPDGTFEVSVIP